jgi:hypothetical protein
MGWSSVRVAITAGLGEKFFPIDSAMRIRKKLLAATSPEASDWSLFIFASQLAESCGTGRVRQFNALYAYHRALIVLSGLTLILFLCSFYNGFASTLTGIQNIVVLLGRVSKQCIAPKVPVPQGGGHKWTDTPTT